jgi:ubiquinone/menaquinone biosynthesis C-methylase UbiE
MTTRWDDWYSRDNLARDEGILAAPATQCASSAATEFLSRGKKRILDLACGVGRDTFLLEKQGLILVGVDASLNGLRAAQGIKVVQEVGAVFVNADARSLPFQSNTFDGIYCFGLLHEFVGSDCNGNVAHVIAEISRLLCTKGILAIAALAGNPEEGLPQVQLFTRQMFEGVITGLIPLEIKCYDDIGCTNRTGYRIWYGLFEK